MMTLQEAAGALAAHAARTTGVACFGSVGTDSRAVAPGQLFVALRGEHFDGHDFVAQAAAAGAAAALVDTRWADSQTTAALPLAVVDDTRLALGTLAAAWRARFTLPLIGVTGSNGKTTVKDMCAAILRAQARRDGYGGEGDDGILATRGNFNNDIGLPLTLFELRAGHRGAVIEMGMNRPGEIAYLSRLAQPTVAIVNNAQRAHLLGLGSLAEVARAKGEIYTGLGGAGGGVAVINADDAHAGYWRTLNAGRAIVTFGIDQAADVRGRCTLHGLGLRLELAAPQGSAVISLQVPGLHNARNAVGAAAACLAAGVTFDAVVEGLSTFTAAQGRLQRRTGPGGCLVLDDTYNANPDSVRAGIDVLAATPGRKILVLGDMGEIGEASAQLHDEIGGYAKSRGVDRLYALGEMSAVAVRNFGDGGCHFDSPDILATALAGLLDADTVVLVKGSRFMRMERVVEQLVAPRDGAGTEGTDA